MKTMFRKLRVLKINQDNPQDEAIKIAAGVLREGGLVAFPTETVYGLGADYSNKSAVKRVYKVKDRPATKPLTLHISDMDMLRHFISDIPTLAQKLINYFWPGPLTIVLKDKKGAKLGFRMPKNNVALKLIKEVGSPVVAPSANPSGEKAPNDAKEIIQSLGEKIDMILDGGETRFGLESTVVDSTVFPIKVLREGAITKSQIADAWHD